MSGLVCPTCGGRMQASTALYLEVNAAGVLYTSGLNTEQVRYYCEHDHPATPKLAQRIERTIGRQLGQLAKLMEGGL